MRLLFQLVQFAVLSFLDFERIFANLHKIAEYCANSTSLPTGRREIGYLLTPPLYKILPK
jgi:hypothetical protein